MHASLIGLLKGAVQLPSACGGGVRPSALRGGGEKHENKSLFFKILNAPFLTFPRCAGEGVNRQRRYTPLMLEKSLL